MVGGHGDEWGRTWVTGRGRDEKRVTISYLLCVLSIIGVPACRTVIYSV